MEVWVDGMNEISGWILGYGDKVKVLAPEHLREKISKIAQNMVDINQQEERQLYRMQRKL